MSLFNNYTKEGKGISKDPDNRLRIVVFFDIYFRKFWNLILINLLYLVACIPIITIGPATAGVTKILRNYAREEHAFILADFFETFKRNFWKALLVSIIDAVAAVLIYFDIVMYSSLEMGGAVTRTISLAVLMLSGTILLFMNYYIFTMMITFDLNFKQLMKNAFIFAWIGFWRNLLITLILAIITFFVLAYFSFIGTFLVIFLYFSTCGLIINFITYPLIKKHMIDGRDPKTGEKLEDNNIDKYEESENDD